MKKAIFIIILAISVNLNGQVYKDQNKATLTNKTSKKIKKDALKKERNNAINPKSEDINLLQKYEGIWTTEDSAFITVFTHNPNNDTLQVYAFSFDHNGLVEEKIIDIKDAVVKTHVINSLNGWDVEIEYKVISDNMLIGKFSGDTDGESLFHRADLIYNHPVNESTLALPYNKI